MTNALIFLAALLALDIAILASLYRVCRNAAPPQQQSRPYRRVRFWNFR